MSSDSTAELPGSAGLISRGMREVLAILAFSITLFLVLALASHDLSDPGWHIATQPDHIENLGGRTGAWIADVLLSLFGAVAYLLPIVLLYLVVLTYRGWNSTPRTDLGIRSLSLLILVLSCSGISMLHFQNIDSGEFPQSVGGILGHVVASGLSALLGLVGTTLALFAISVCAAPIAFRFSWLKVVDRLGGWVLSRGEYVLEFIENRRTRDSATTTDQASDEQWSMPPAEKRAAVASAPELPEPAQEKTGLSSLISKKPKPKKAKKTPTVDVPDAQLALPITGGGEQGKDVEFSGNPLPPVEVLDPPVAGGLAFTSEQLHQMSTELEQHLADFGVTVKVVGVAPGPVITRFEVQPAPGVKVNQITNLSKDLARAMSTVSVRVVEVIAGKSVIGLELPNQQRELVGLREVLESSAYSSAPGLTLAMGKDISGNPVVANLAKMPHLLVAGTTGSGKSVAINVMILSLLYKRTAKEVRLILIDPKMLELSVYEDIPHLLAPVVTDMKEAANALRWCVAEMDRRYKVMASVGVRNLEGFNRKVKAAIEAGEPLIDKVTPVEDGGTPLELEPLPQIVIIVDELADMMMVVGKKVEELIARLAQKARAAGLHLILATQRPSVDVITGLIKANIPTRAAFQVSSKIDSRTILDQPGAESLLGHGDMLFLPPGTAIPARVHGAFVDDHEVHKVVDYLKQSGRPEYIDEIVEGADDASAGGELGAADDAEADPLYDQAVAIVAQSRKASISWVQRRLKIGYNRAARMVESMEQAGVVSAVGDNGMREVLVPPPPED